MDVQPGHEEVGDSEILYRRIPEVHYDANLKAPRREAFQPNDHDLTGISVSRAKYTTPLQAIGARRTKPTYVAVLNAHELRQHGIQIVPKPEPENVGHAELPNLRKDNRKETNTIRLQGVLVTLCTAILGPYTPPPSADP